MSGLEIYDDEQTIFSSDAHHNISNQHQVYVIIDKTSKEFDDKNNLVINSQIKTSEEALSTELKET
jgi:hypothetical protein